MLLYLRAFRYLFKKCSGGFLTHKEEFVSKSLTGFYIDFYDGWIFLKMNWNYEGKCYIVQ